MRIFTMIPNGSVVQNHNKNVISKQKTNDYEQAKIMQLLLMNSPTTTTKTKAICLTFLNSEQSNQIIEDILFAS